MFTSDGHILSVLGILAIFVLVAANGFFVTAEFSLVAVRRSRVAELVAAGRMNAKALQRAVNNLDANLAATQLGITISSLALGWIGEPVLAQLIEPFLRGVPHSVARAESHGIAVAIAFTIITALHIVLGELAPKSVALQRSERAALWVVRPLGVFLLLFRPAIVVLNGLGNFVIRRVGLRPESEEKALHSPEELKLLVQASHAAGILQHQQQEVVVRVLSIGARRIQDIMTPRMDIDWIDVQDSPQKMLRIIRECRHEHLLVGRGGIDEPLGVLSKKDLLDQLLDGHTIEPLKVMQKPLLVHEMTSIFKVLEQFKQKPVHLGVIINEYGNLEGIVTQADLLEALAGDLPAVEGDEPDIFQREDGSFLIEGTMSVQDALDRLGIRAQLGVGIHTVAGFALMQFGHLPKTGETFSYEGWCFEILDMDGLRIDKLLARRNR